MWWISRTTRKKTRKPLKGTPRRDENYARCAAFTAVNFPRARDRKTSKKHQQSSRQRETHNTAAVMSNL